jgi:hypothetical protein
LFHETWYTIEDFFLSSGERAMCMVVLESWTIKIGSHVNFFFPKMRTNKIIWEIFDFLFLQLCIILIEVWVLGSQYQLTLSKVNRPCLKIKKKKRFCSTFKIDTKSKRFHFFPIPYKHHVVYWNGISWLYSLHCNFKDSFVNVRWTM